MIDLQIEIKCSRVDEMERLIHSRVYSIAHINDISNTIKFLIQNVLKIFFSFLLFFFKLVLIMNIAEIPLA